MMFPAIFTFPCMKSFCGLVSPIAVLVKSSSEIVIVQVGFPDGFPRVTEPGSFVKSVVHSETTLPPFVNRQRKEALIFFTKSGYFGRLSDIS